MLLQQNLTKLSRLRQKHFCSRKAKVKRAPRSIAASENNFDLLNHLPAVKG